jgi:hypothetical protein
MKTKLNTSKLLFLWGCLVNQDGRQHNIEFFT